MNNYAKGRVTEREGEKWREGKKEGERGRGGYLSITVSLLRSPQEPELCQDKAKSEQLHFGLPAGGRSPTSRVPGPSCATFSDASLEMGQPGLQQHSNMGCQQLQVMV